jgi:hypothetical protein
MAPQSNMAGFFYLNFQIFGKNHSKILIVFGENKWLEKTPKWRPKTKMASD